jgi:hypothetical protein
MRSEPWSSKAPYAAMSQQFSSSPMHLGWVAPNDSRVFRKRLKRLRRRHNTGAQAFHGWPRQTETR